MKAGTRRVRKARRREKIGLYRCSFDYRAEFLNALVQWGWLPNKDFHTNDEIRRGLRRGFVATLKNERKINGDASRCPHCGRNIF